MKNVDCRKGAELVSNLYVLPYLIECFAKNYSKEMCANKGHTVTLHSGEEIRLQNVEKNTHSQDLSNFYVGT